MRAGDVGGLGSAQVKKVNVVNAWAIVLSQSAFNASEEEHRLSQVSNQESQSFRLATYEEPI